MKAMQPPLAARTDSPAGGQGAIRVLMGSSPCPAPDVVPRTEKFGGGLLGSVLPAGDEVEDVAQHGAVALIYLGVAALLAGDGGELLVLDVEEPGVLPGGAELAGFELRVPALGADVG